MRLKTYWHVITSLFTSPKYYLEIFKAPFWFSFRFFIISMTILGLTLTWRVNQKVMPTLQEQMNVTLDEVVTNYPADLEIVWSENQLRYSAEDAIEISYPSLMGQNSQLPPVFGYFIPGEISSAQFSEKLEHESLFVVSSDKFFINDLREAWTDAPLTEILPEEDLVLNKDTSGEFISKFKLEIEEIIPIIKQLNFIAIPIGLIIFRLWMSFLEAILVFLFFKLNKFNLNFGKTIQLSLHLVVVAETIAQIANWIYPNIQISMLVLVYWSVFSYVFWTQREHFSKLKIKTALQD